jgi:hypothetical protein
VRRCGIELVGVVLDEKYPGMWRVRSAEGGPVIIVNITWMKAAAAISRAYVKWRRL